MDVVRNAAISFAIGCIIGGIIFLSISQQNPLGNDRSKIQVCEPDRGLVVIIEADDFDPRYYSKELNDCM